MEIVFCMDRVIGEQEATEIMNELRCSTPILEGYFCCKEDASVVGDAQDMIEYRIKNCPAMADLQMDEKMDKIVSAFKIASQKTMGVATAPVWIHIYYGIKKKFLAYLSWKPYRYFSAGAMDRDI